MKRITALGAAALSMVSFSVVPAFAQEPDMGTIPFRLLSDPAYLPYGGQLFGSSAFTIEDSTYDHFGSTGAENYRGKEWEDEISQTFEYGITDDLAVRVSDSYVPFDKQKHDFVAGGFDESTTSGFTDPSIGVTWRVIDQANAPMNVDLLADYSPDLISASTNNLARGSQTLNFGGAVSEVLPYFTIYGKALAEWYGQGGVYDPVDADFTHTSSYWNYLLNLETQTRLNRWFSVNAGVGYEFAGNSNVSNVTTGIDHFANRGDGLTLNAALNYQVVPNMLVASLTYDYRHDGTSSSFYPAVPASSTYTQNRDDNTFGVKFDYVMP